MPTEKEIASAPVSIARPRSISDPDVKPSAGELFTIAVFATLLRAGLFLIVTIRFGYTFHQWAMRDDGSSYIAYAQALLGDASHMTPYDQRVFPGYPAMIAILHRVGIPFDAAAVGLDWSAAGIVAALGAMLFRDRRIGWALTCLPLQYFINSSLTMSEGSMLALALMGLLLSQRAMSIGGGLMLGFAGLVRPMACFAVLGQIISSIVPASGPRVRRAIVVALFSSVVVAGGMFALHRWTGDAFRGAKIYANAPNTYNGHLIQPPFHSLIHESFRREVPAGRIFYIWLHVAIVLSAIGLLLSRTIRNGTSSDARDLLATPWLVGNTLFVLCIGSFWGFEHFPRFTIPALPALFWGLRDFLPRRRIFWLGIGAVILVAASFVVLQNFVVTD